jgi:thiol:disulfide interchange protein DsbD
MKKVFSLLLLTVISLSLHAQGIQKPVKWSASVRKISAQEAELQLQGKIEGAWIIYSINVPEDGPMPISVMLEPSDSYKPLGKLVEVSKPKEKYDAMFDMTVNYFAKEVILSQRIALQEGAQNPTTITGNVEYQCCNDKECLLLNEDFSAQLITFTAQPKESKIPKIEPAATPVITQQTPATLAEEKSREAEGALLSFFLLAMLAGLAGVLTPCVFPMLPMTISFFMRGHSRRKGLRKAIVFGISIVAIYTFIGAIVAATKTADITNVVSTHWLPNLIFFALFVLFAASFFGAMEIQLPTKLANRIDQKADKGGYFSTFFVALALTIVSFSCTGPFVGALLVTAASGAVLKPVIGMFGFGLAFAAPFTILALFPAALKKLPKSGGWMNTIKVFFAFILAIFSMKFLSVADSALGFNIISRELFICIWVVLFALQGLYFLGKLRFAHDDKLERIGVFRLLLAIISLCFALYLFTGLMGNPLSSLSGFLPQNRVEKVVQTGENSTTAVSANTAQMLCSASPKYGNLGLHAPANLPSFFDLEEALACAKQQDKLLFIAFKGHHCSNCKKMEGSVFSDKRVVQQLQEKYVIATLYIDDKTELPMSEWYTSNFDGKQKKTLGQKNLDYLMSAFKVNAIPYFTMLDSDGSLVGKPVGYVAKADSFLRFLQQKE